MSILVTGGAGYIGSHVVRLLQENSEDVVVIDDLSTGVERRVSGVDVVPIDLSRNEAATAVHSCIESRDVTAVIHLAALKQVGESVHHPARYYRENIAALANVLEAMEGTRARQFVFSSSAAVYGNPTHELVSEDDPTIPVNPYGETKLAGEWLTAAAASAAGLKAVSLRYFNVAGAGWPDLGDSKPLNLVTLAIAAIRAGDRPTIFGTDFATPDGTGVRDYVHVRDLAAAHLAALQFSETQSSPFETFNVGTGTGASVREVIAALSAASGRPIEPHITDRRVGDPARVVADVSRIATRMGWVAEFDLADMVASAWEASTQGTPPL